MEKKALIMLLILVASINFVACEKKEEETTTVEENPETEENDTDYEEYTESEVVEENPEIETEAEPDLTYVSLYLNQINEIYTSGTADQFALVNVDGDDIPELAAVSSEGSWDKDQIFLYKIFDNQIVLLASDIAPGMEGHSIAYYEGENVVVKTGAAAGFREEYYQINQEQLELIFSVTYDYIDEDLYKVNDQNVSEDEYYQTITNLISSLGPIITLGGTEMDVETVSCDNGYPEYIQQDTRSYMTYEEIISQLKKLLGEKNFNNEKILDWQTTYKKILYDIMADKEYLHDFNESYSYSQNGMRAFFTLKDITGDNIPELWVSGYNDNFWYIYSVDDNNNISNIIEQMVIFYNPEQNKLYANSGGYSELFTIYSYENGTFIRGCSLWQEDGYYNCNEYYEFIPMTDEEANQFINDYSTGLEKYKLSGVELTPENIDIEFSKF